MSQILLENHRFKLKTIFSYYFWKWADNDLPCHPLEAHAALLRGQFLPALQTFDARPLIRKLKELAVQGGRSAEEWHWEIIPARALGQAQCVFVTCPCLDHPRKRRWKMVHHLFSLDLVPCDAETGRMVDFGLPKINSMEMGKWPDGVVYDVKIDDLPALLRRIRAGWRQSAGVLTNRQNHFVTCGKMGNRYHVEWRENHSLSDLKSFDHWMAEYPAESKVPQRYVPKGLFSIRNSEQGDYEHELGENEEELLRFSDALRIYEAFVRGEPRPAQYHWKNINHIVP